MAGFTTAIHLDSGYAIAYYNRGIIYLEQGEYDLAMRDFERYLELEPNSAQRGAILDTMEQLKAELNGE